MIRLRQGFGGQGGGGICATPPTFFEGDVGVADVGAGVHEGDELRGIPGEGVAGTLFAVFHDGVEVLEESHFRTRLL